jgi:hypothetical protein
MHWNKTFAGILLIFSIANVVLAAPALIRQRHFVTDRADDEPTGESNLDPAGSVHQEVVPAVTPPPVGSPTGSEKSPTLSEMWSDGSLLDYLAESSSNEDSVPNSPSTLHQDSVPVSGAPAAPQLHDDLPLVSGSPRLQDRPFPWWLYTDWRPPGTYEVGESSHTASHAQMLPPAPPSGAQPLHDDALWFHEHELNPVTDMDQASTMSWSSKVSGWEEEEEKVAEETHLHV